MNTCKHCNERFYSSHYCRSEHRTITENDTGDFLLSAAIGFGTDSAILGGLLGGDMTGGILGDILDGDLFD